MPKTIQEDLLDLIARNNVNAVNTFLDTNPSLVNSSVDGKTPLIKAAINSNGDGMIRLLVKRGAKRDYKYAAVNESTALMNAVRLGFFKNVLALVEPSPGNDPAINAKAKNGNTALMYSSDPEITALLLDVGADANATNNEGKTALDLATSDAMRHVLNAESPLERASIVDKLPQTLYRTAIKVLGKGAFGEVSQTVRNGTPVAIKRVIFDEKERKNKNNIQKSSPIDLIHEIHGLQKVANSNYAVHYINSNSGPRNGYIITELLQGMDLLDAIIKNQITNFNIKQITRDLLLGLDEIHDRKVLHLDIKPTNIWFYPNKNEKTIKYIDFGTWCKIPCTLADNRGTPGYSKIIEPTSDNPFFDKTSDFYGLARTLADIITQKKYESKNTDGTFYNPVFEALKKNKPWNSTGFYSNPSLGSEMQNWLAGVLYKLLHLTNEQNAIDALTSVGGLRRTKKRSGRRSIRRRLN